MRKLPSVQDLLADRFRTVAIEGEDPLTLRVSPRELIGLALTLRDEHDLSFDLLYSVSGVDRDDHLEAVYHVYSRRRAQLIVLKVDAWRAEPCVPSVADVWPAADWHERECFDLFGIVFDGHPDLRHLLVVDAEGGHLLRKDVEIRTVDETRVRVRAH